jgi:hypothetical protein
MALPAQRINRVPNPSAEVATPFVNLSNCTVARVSTSPHVGTWHTRITVTTTATAWATTATGTSGFPVVAGTTYQASAYLKRNGATSRVGEVRMAFYTAAGAFISTLGTAGNFTYTTTYDRASNSIVAPATAAFAALYVGITGATAGETFDVDALLVEDGATLGVYFDGATVETGWTHAWTGTANASTSTRDVYGIWPEQVVGAGAPRAQITVIGLGITSVTTQVVREAGGETWSVPGWKRRNTLGGDTLTDWAPPLGREIKYTLLVNGQAVSTRTLTVTSDKGWVQSPTQPDIAMPIALDGTDPNQIALAKPSLKSVTYGIRSEEEFPMGGRYAIARSSARSAAGGVALVLNAATNAVSDQFLDLVEASPILLFRSLPSWGSLPALAYMLGDVEEAPLNRDRGGQFTQWTTVGRLTTPVSLAPVTGNITNQMVADNLVGRTNASIAAASGNKRNIDIAANPLGLGS